MHLCNHITADCQDELRAVKQDMKDLDTSIDKMDECISNNQCMRTFNNQCMHTFACIYVLIILAIATYPKMIFERLYTAEVH